MENEQKTNPLDIEIGSDPISVRLCKCLMLDQLFYWRDVVPFTAAEILRKPNLGRKSLNELKFMLEELGLRLGMTSEEIEKIDGEYK